MANQNFNEEAVVQAVIKALGKLNADNTSEVQSVPVATQVEDKYVSDDELVDIATIPEDELCLVDNPKNKEALMRMKKFTPARIATGRVGDREQRHEKCNN